MKKENKKILNHFPPEIAKLIEEGRESIECPIEYLVTSAITIGAICIGASASVRPKNEWAEYPSVYSLLIGNPSMKKTPALKLIKKPLEVIQKRLHEEYRIALAAYKAMPKDERRSTFEPLEEVVYSTDSTIEALLKYLSNSPIGVSLIVDELSHLFKSLNSYKQGGGDRQYLLQLYNHSQVTVTRKGEPSLHIDNPVVSILGGIQPKVLKEFFSKGEEDGMTERFLYVHPKESISTKFNDAEVKQETIDSYVEYIQNIFEKSYYKALEGKCDNYILSVDSKKLWIEWMEGQDADIENISYLKKSHAISLRLALVLEVLNHPERTSMEISEKSMEGAIRLTNYYIDSYFKTKDFMNQSEAASKTEKLLDWMIGKHDNKNYNKVIGNLEGLKIHKMLTNGPAGIRKRHQALEILTVLEEEGKGFLYPSKSRKVKGSTNPEIFCLHPKYKK